MFRKRIRAALPSIDIFETYAWARPFKPFLGHPNIWALNRRSVAGGVAIGLFCGLIPGPFQMFGSLLAVMLFRANLPVALLTTLYTNPLTIVPLYVFAVAYGQLLLGTVDPQPMAPLPQWDWSQWGLSTAAYWDWALGLGPALMVGLPATMLTFAVLGYVGVRAAWALAVRRAWEQRCKRSERLPSD